jgi:CRP-like cAMP-binding protein
MTAKKITDFLESLAPIPYSCVKSIHGLLVIEELPKKKILLKEGQVCDRVYFVEKGLLRSYYKDDTGAERTGWIMKELDVVTSPRSFYNREASNEYIETLEPSIVGFISYDEMHWLYKEFIEFNVVGRILNERYNVLAVTRAEELRLNDATTRYQVFVKNYPGLADRVPLRYIASYIGVDEATLYKIRNGNYSYPRKQ